MRLGFDDLNPAEDFDVCIVGSGPAGMTCAREIAKSGAKVALVEGGDADWTDWSQALYAGEVEGDPFFELEYSRLRYFGGSSGHWAGWCRSFDAHDFKAKGSFNITGWPIGKADIDPYLERACADLEIPARFADREIPDSGFRWIEFQHSPPVRYGEKYGEEVFASPNIHLFLNTNAESYETNGRAITGLHVLSVAGEAKTLRARAYVLAAGGIENSRVLLWSNRRTNDQVVKDPTTLGGYWMEHPQATVGDVILRNPGEMDLDENGFVAYAPDAATVAAGGGLNCTLGVTHYDREGTKRLIASMGCVAPGLADWFFELAGSGKICGARLDAQWEQEPRPENRITLDSEADALGIPRTRLHWARSETDLHTVRAMTLRFADFVAEADVGRARLDEWILDAALPYPDDERIGSQHHMGGTRMAATAAEGVVDGNCRVFGQENLYVAGSSIFPSGGYTNPTLPIVQFAHRLADHIVTVHGPGN